MSPAELAVLLPLNSVGIVLLVLGRLVIAVLALTALEGDSFPHLTGPPSCRGACAPRCGPSAARHAATPRPRPFASSPSRGRSPTSRSRASRRLLETFRIKGVKRAPHHGGAGIVTIRSYHTSRSLSIAIQKAFLLLVGGALLIISLAAAGRPAAWRDRSQ